MNYIIFNHDGSIKNVNFAEIIVQGNNLVDEIFVAVEGRSTDSYLATAYFELPNGDSNFLTATLASHSIDQSAYNGYKFLLTGAQTAFYGRVRMSLKLEGMQGETLWTYEQFLTINKSGYNPDFTMISMSQYAALLQAMGSLQEKFVVNNARFYSSLANAQADLDNLAFNQCVIIADVTATDPIPEIYFKNSESQLELLAGIGEYTFQAGTTTTQTLSPGSDATVSVSFVASGKTITMNFTFGIPRGNTGATGNGIASIAKVSTVGLVDTYRITFTNGSHFDYTITNGTLAGKLEVATFVYDSSSALNFTQQLAKFIIGLVGNDLDKVKSITRLYTVPSAYQEYRGETVLFDIFRYTDFNSKFYLPDGTQITTSSDAYQFSILYEVDGITVADIGYFELSSSDTSGYLDEDEAEEATKTVCLIKRGNDIFYFAQEYEGTKYFKTIPLMRVTGYKQGSIEINGLDSNSPTWEYASEDYDMDSAPTQNSPNLVTSGGVYSAIATASAALDSKITALQEIVYEISVDVLSCTTEYTDLLAIPSTISSQGVIYSAGAEVNSIKFYSVVANQLVQNGNFASASGWGIDTNFCTLSVSNNIATITANMAITGPYQVRLEDARRTFQNGNKILIGFFVKSSKAITIKVDSSSSLSPEFFTQELTANTWTYISRILTGTNVSQKIWIYPSVGYDSFVQGDTLQYKDFQIFDLSQAFPFGTPTTTDDPRVKQLLSKYHDYNSGSLVDCEVTAIRVRGYNLFDEVMESGIIQYDMNSANFGQNIAFSSNIRSKNYIEVSTGKTLYFKGANASMNAIVFCYDGNKNPIVVGSTGYITIAGTPTFDPPLNCKYIRFYMTTGYGTTYNHDICINYSNDSLNGTYKPYRAPTDYPLPSGITQRGVWTAHDTLTAWKFTREIGKKTVGEADWSYDENYHCFYSYISDRAQDASVVVVGYQRDYNLTSDKTYSWSTSSNRIWIRDDSYQGDAAAFKAERATTEFIYNLATHIETPVDFDPNLDLEEGDSIELVNGNASWGCLPATDFAFATKKTN